MQTPSVLFTWRLPKILRNRCWVRTSTEVHQPGAAAPSTEHHPRRIRICSDPSASTHQDSRTTARDANSSEGHTMYMPSAPPQSAAEALETLWPTASSDEGKASKPIVGALEP